MRNPKTKLNLNKGNNTKYIISVKYQHEIIYMVYNYVSCFKFPFKYSKEILVL